MPLPLPLLGSLPALRMLVVEDNPINQEVTRAQLSALGIASDLAEDGTGALQLLAKQRYAAVLMDCQLPGLNGYETTRRLRQMEGQMKTGPRTPVIAVTAHALPGEREKCLAAGMDGHLAKPLRLEDLRTALSRLLPEVARAPRPRARPLVLDPVPASLDPGRLAVLRQLEARTGELIVRRLAASFPPQARLHLAEMRKAVQDHDPRNLERASHTLKGGAANVGAPDLARSCAEMENRARAGEASGCGELLERIAAECARVERDLATLE